MTEIRKPLQSIRPSNSARAEKEYFGKEALRKRKIEIAGEFDGLDEYITQASELNEADLEEINIEVEKAKIIWQRIRPLRDKIYAHSEILTPEQRADLYKAVTNSDIEDIIQILLNISNALLQFEINGRALDLSCDYRRPIDEARADMDKLIKSLVA